MNNITIKTHTRTLVFARLALESTLDSADSSPESADSDTDLNDNQPTAHIKHV